jgi:4-aminobutyrate aminotransferase/(S)-3-amino-2-methylpropionate transaminase
MSDTVRKYRDYVITSFVKSVQSVVIERASGATITDTSGREYIDCFAGISVVNAGHNNPAVVEAAKSQLEKLVHCASYIYYSQPTADAAERLARIMPGPKLRKTFFGNGGAEAVEGALKVANVVDRPNLRACL